MYKILFKFYLVFCSCINLYSYEISADGENHAPYSAIKYIELSVPVGDEVFTKLKGKDAENDKIYFIITNNSSLNYGTAKIVNGSKFKYRANKNIVNVTKNGLRCEDSGSVCDYVKYKIKDSNGKYSDEYTINIRIQEVFDKDNYDPSPSQGFNVRAFNSQMLNSMSNSENNFMNSDNPTQAAAENTNNIFAGSMDFASNAQHGDSFSNKALKTNPSSRDALLTLQGDGNLAKDNTILDEAFYAKIKKMSYRHNPLTEQVLKTCRIERAGGVLKTFFVCPLDSNYPDNLDQATLFRAAYGEEDKAMSMCESSCRQTSTCNLVSPYHDIVLFKNKSSLTQEDVTGFKDILKDTNVTKLTMRIENNEGVLVKEYSSVFANDVEGSLFHWHNDINGTDIHINDFKKANNINLVPGTNVFFIYDIASEHRTNEYYSFNTEKGLLDVVVPRFFWLMIGQGSTEPVNDRLFTVTATVRQNMYRCPINNIPNDQLLHDDKDSCNVTCAQSRACVSKTYVDVGDIDKIENHCKDMTIMYENQERSLEYLSEQGKCQIYEESVVDFSSEHKNYFVQNFEISDAFRPFGDFNDSITEFPTKSSQLVNENVIGVLGAFQNMIQTQGSINKMGSSLPLNSEEYIDLNGSKIDHLFYPFSILLYSGMSNSNRQVGLVVRPNPKIVNKMKDATHTQDYGLVAISFEPDIRTFSNHNADDENETIFRYFLIDKDGNRTLVREENATGNYNRSTMTVSGAVVGHMKVDKNMDQFLPIIYNNANTNEDLDNAFFDFQFIKNVNFLDNPESKLFIYYDTIENINNTNIQDIIDSVKSNYLLDKRYLALDYFYVNDVLQTRQDVDSITSDGIGNYIVNFKSKEKYYGTLGKTFEKYLKQFPGHGDIPSFLFDEAGLRYDSVAISRRGVDTNMSIDIKVSPDLNETKNGYYFTYFKKDDNDNAFFVFPVGTEGNYISEGGDYRCSYTSDIFGSINSCESYCTNGNYISTIDQTATITTGTCTLLGSKINTSGVLYDNEENCIKGSDIASVTNAQSNIVNARFRFETIGQSLTKKYNLHLNRYKSLGSVTPYLNYDSKIIENATTVQFGNSNIININGLKKNEKLDFSFKSEYNSNRYWMGLGLWNAIDINTTLGREPLSEEIHIDSKIDDGYCFDMQRYYNGVKLYFEIDKDFDGIYEESVAVMEPFICSHANTNNLKYTVEFLGNKIRYEYVKQDGEKTTGNIHNLIYKQKGKCRELTSVEQQNSIDNGIFSSKWNGVLPDSALTTNIFGVYKHNATASIDNLSEFKNARNGKTEKIFLKKVNIDNFKSISDANISDLRKYVDDPSLMPIPIDFGAYKEDRANFMFRELNTAGFEDYKVYAGYGHEPWSSCLTFKAPITVSKNLVDSSAPLSNGCPAGYSYNNVTQVCTKKLTHGSTDSSCPNGSKYNSYIKKCEKNIAGSYVMTFKAKNAQSKFNIVNSNDIESMMFHKNYHLNADAIASNDFEVKYKGDTVLSASRKADYDFMPLISDGENIIELDGTIYDIVFYTKYNNGTFNTGDGIIELDKVRVCPSSMPNTGAGNLCSVDVNCRLDGTAPSATYYPAEDSCKTSFTDPCTDGKIYDNATGECQKNTTEIVQIEQNVKVCKPWWVIQRVYKCNPDVVDTNYIEDKLSFSYPRRVQMCKVKQIVPKTVFMDTNGTIE